MNATQLKSAVLGGEFDARFTYIYGVDALAAQKVCRRISVCRSGTGDLFGHGNLGKHISSAVQP